MKDYSRIHGAIYGEAWVIRSDAYGQIRDQFEAFVKNGGKDGMVDAGDPVGPHFRDMAGNLHPLHPQVEEMDGLALIRVHGILGKHLSFLAMSCGGFDTGLLVEQMDNIRDDESIKTVVIDIRSPGGMVIGMQAAAAAIRRVSESGKRVIAYTDLDCCSGGYWLASACDEFYAEQSAIIGSISSYCAGVDSSKKWEKEGKALKLFRSGHIKGMGADGKEWTKEEEAFMQEKADSTGKVFKDFVRARRGVSDDAMEGQFWYAQDAPVKVVDGLVSSLRNLLAGLMTG